MFRIATDELDLILAGASRSCVSLACRYFPGDSREQNMLVSEAAGHSAEEGVESTLELAMDGGTATLRAEDHIFVFSCDQVLGVRRLGNELIATTAAGPKRRVVLRFDETSDCQAAERFLRRDLGLLQTVPADLWLLILDQVESNPDWVALTRTCSLLWFLGQTQVGR